MQGTVMKITNEQIVVLCDDGMFRNQPLQSPLPALGERIVVQPQSVKGRTRTRYHMKRWAAVALIGLFIMLSYTMIESSFSSRTAAMVAIDINPSVELLVTRKGKIEKLVHTSEDAETLVSADQLLNMDFYEAVHVLVFQAESQGLLNKESHDALVLMSVVNMNNAQFQIDLSRFNDINQYDIELYYATNEDKEQAQTAQLTLNKYYVYQQGREMGIEWHVDELRQKSIAESLIESGWEPEIFFEQARQRSIEEADEAQQNETPVVSHQNETASQNKASNGSGSKNIEKNENKKKENNEKNKNKENNKNKEKNNKNKEKNNKNKEKNNKNKEKNKNKENTYNSKNNRNKSGHAKDNHKSQHGRQSHADNQQGHLSNNNKEMNKGPNNGKSNENSSRNNQRNNTDKSKEKHSIEHKAKQNDKAHK